MPDATNLKLPMIETKEYLWSSNVTVMFSDNLEKYIQILELLLYKVYFDCRALKPYSL